MARRCVELLVPKALLQWPVKSTSRRIDRAYGGLPPEEIFDRVYSSKVWGGDEGTDFFSGVGSHDPEMVTPYVDAVSGFITGLGCKPAVVDLGCGDFNVGKHFVSLCNQYIACDIVPRLVERNKATYLDSGVDFRCLNIIIDDLPAGDIALIRQVLQHLSNSQILSIIPKLLRYKFVVITEHLPTSTVFIPNLDKPAGPGIRIGVDSGIVLTEAPFNLGVRDERVLCCLERLDGRVQTIVYRIRDLQR